MVELIFLAAIQWHHFETCATWDESPTATHYWFCVSDTAQDFTLSLEDTPALCAPVLEGRRYCYYDGFTGRVFQGKERYFSVAACNGVGCSNFRD